MNETDLCPFCNKPLGDHNHQWYDDSVGAYAHDLCSGGRVTWSDVDRARARVRANPGRYAR